MYLFWHSVQSCSIHSDSEPDSSWYPFIDSGAPTLPGPRPPLVSGSNPSKGARSLSLNASANIVPAVGAIGFTKDIDSGVGDMEINGATPLVTTGTVPTVDDGTPETGAAVDDGVAMGESTAGTTVTWDGGDAEVIDVVMGFTTEAEGTILLEPVVAPAATLFPVIALGNENTPTDAISCCKFQKL